MNSTNEIAILERGPEMITTIEDAKERLGTLQRFVKLVMKEGSDYGVVPGTEKPTLLKPGAEKLANIYGLYSEIHLIERLEDWDKPFFNYLFKTITFSMRTGIKVSEGVGSCNSYENKYRYRWVFESDLSAEDKADKDNLKKKEFYSKNQGRNYTMYRVLNDDIFSQVNTMQKMAAKRSYVDAVLKATRTSDFFTQDLEDISDTYKPVRTEKTDKANKKDLLEKISALRDTVGMDKEELHKIVEEKFKTADVSKLSIQQLTEIHDELDTRLMDAVDETDSGQ